jgi:hypothetical protein
MIIGMALVVAGVLCVELASGRAARKREVAE